MESNAIEQDWTLAAYVIHNETLRVANEKHDKELRDEEKEHNRELRDSDLMHAMELKEANEKFLKEQDRRYSEVNVEKEKALKIKETADLAALELARESQKYKEERNDAQREQTITDRGAYVTHDDLAEVVKDIGKQILPIINFVKNHEGAEKGSGFTQKQIVTALGVIATVLTILVIFKNWGA